MSNRSKRVKYQFVLQNVNSKNIDKIHGINIDQDDFNTEEKSHTTKLFDLDNDKYPTNVSFLDESKRPHSCSISMIDFSSGKNINELKYNCFWDKHPINTVPIGCPLRYVPSQVEKRFHSHINSDTYIIKEEITNKQSKNIVNTDEIFVKSRDYYETDGVFCSFECCKKWISKRKHKSKYNQSEYLLSKIYCDYYGKRVKIMEAPSLRKLKSYGGNLTIEEFRQSLSKIEYKDCGIIRKLPEFRSIGKLYEENIKF